MSERFPARKGISASLLQRLGDFGNKETSLKKQHNMSARGYNSGDSLEMDEGDDLRGELDGHHAANMVIQVGT